MTILRTFISSLTQAQVSGPSRPASARGPAVGGGSASAGGRGKTGRASSDTRPSLWRIILRQCFGNFFIFMDRNATFVREISGWHFLCVYQFDSLKGV